MDTRLAALLAEYGFPPGVVEKIVEEQRLDQPAEAAAPPKPAVCPCGIARVDCEYHRT